MSFRSSFRRLSLLVTCLVAVAAAIPLSGCAKKSAKPVNVVAARNKVKRSLRRPYVAIRANETSGGSEYDMVPLDLWMPCRWEATFGLFDPARTEGLDGAFFGTALDTRGAADLDYFGIYASRQPGGLYVSSETEDPVTDETIFPGGTFLAGASRIDAAIDLDGTTLRFFVRDADQGGAYQEIGSIPFSTQDFPLNPGIEVGGMEGRAEVGYTHLRVVSNSPPPSPVDEAHAAMNGFLAALQTLAEVKYALAEGGATVGAVLAKFDEALAAIEDARTTVAAIPATARRDKAARAKSLAAARQAVVRLGKARTALEGKGEAGFAAATSAVGLRAYDVLLAADRILPRDVRDDLPGGRHTLLK